jgi:hypothetical protein
MPSSFEQQGLFRSERICDMGAVAATAFATSALVALTLMAAHAAALSGDPIRTAGHSDGYAAPAFANSAAERRAGVQDEPGYQAFLNDIARHEARRRRLRQEFFAEHPAAAGADIDFPYYLALYPVVERRPAQVRSQPSLCVSHDTASYELWCNGMYGIAAISGNWIFLDFDEKTLVLCSPELDRANEALPDPSGAMQWRRDGDLLYIGIDAFRIDADPLSCGKNRKP